MKQLLSALCLLLVFLFGCNSAPKETPSAAPRLLTYRMSEILHETKACAEPEKPCLTVRIGYPVFTGETISVTRYFNEWVAQYVKNFLKEQTGEGKVRTDELKDLLSLLDARHADATAKEGQAGQWSLTLKIEVVMLTEKMMTLRCIADSYTGGAHPNSYVAFQMFDPAVAKEIPASELISNPEALAQLAEEQFRAIRKIAPGEGLNQAGFQFKDNRFSLPKQIGLTEKGLVCYFNTYEVGPYAAGPTEIILPTRQLEKIIRW